MDDASAANGDPFGPPPEHALEEPGGGLDLPTPRKRRSRALVFGAAGLVVLLALGGAALLRLRSVTTTSIAPAAAMPADTTIFVGLDVFQLRDEEQTAALLATFEQIFADLGAPVESADDVVAAIDGELLAAAGVDLSNDVLPWAGRTVGFGLLGIDPAGLNSLDPLGAFDPEENVVLAVEARDPGGADAFVDKLAAGLADRQGMSFAAAEYRGVSMRVAGVDGRKLALSRSADMVLIGGAGAVRSAIDAQLDGRSLAEEESFGEVTAGLPETRLVTYYMNVGPFQQLAEDMATTPGATDIFGSAAGLGMGVTVTTAGLQLDYTMAFGPDGLPAVYELYAPRAAGDLAQQLPADTILYLTTAGPADLWDTFTTQMEAAGMDMQRELAAVEQGLGFSLHDDLIRYLDGPLTLALLSGSDGMLARESGFDLEILASMGTSQPDSVEATLGRITELLRQQGVAVAPGAGGFQAIQDRGFDVLAYGVSDGRLLIGSSSTVLSATGGSKLASTPGFAAVDAALPGEASDIAFYADIGRMVDAFTDEPEIIDALAPLQGLGASARIEGTSITSTMVLLVNTGR